MFKNKVNKPKVKNNSVAIVRQLLKIPGVKVKRDQYLLETFSKQVKTREAKMRLLEEGPVSMFSQTEIDQIAKRCVIDATHKATMMSFVTGLPGGLAILGTLPADMIQVYASTLKMAQELSYLYGAEDIWQSHKEIDNEAEDKLIVYLGVMLGVNTAASATRLLSSTVTKVLMEQGSQQLSHQVAKKVLKVIGIKSSKKGLSKGMAKAIPLAGGVISGSLTYFGVKPMGLRLQAVLSEGAYSYNRKSILDDIQVVESDNETITSENKFSINLESMSERFDSAKRLFDKGLISKEDLINLKDKLIK
ncbi:hypothetical protein G7081_06545 [Vagococcus coleopterorum]|uniref:Bacteriochlorophyll 4-vinyl reductase n=1 Tax=Vagococcus coleopterorum TaxID=2714946 RepID=A0A6G8AP88_9ENTE|nr:hypothetical protein [Vagococcus coleopterorum]QIL46745.1 hypothetical protein G7081_06545 [Vagococcus coleopterorum]